MPKTTEYNNIIQQKLGKLNEWIFRENAVISGSFLISTLRNETYEGQDIDFYTNREFKMRDFQTVDSEFEDFLVNEMGAILKIESYTGLDSRSHKYIIKDWYEINIINIPGRNIKRYIRKTSDLDICTCVYDGLECIFDFSVLTGHAKEINIKTNFGDFKEQERYEFKRKLRISKYLKRGFKIITNLILDEEFIYSEYMYYMKQKNRDEFIINMLNYIADAFKDEEKEHNIVFPYMPLTQAIITNSSLLFFSKNEIIENKPKWIDFWNKN